MEWVDHAAVPVDDAALDDGGAHPEPSADDDADDDEAAEDDDNDRAAAAPDGHHRSLVDDRAAAVDVNHVRPDDDLRRPPRGGLRCGVGPGHCWLGFGGGSHFGGSVVEDGLSQVSVKFVL